jgi:hypothetical protein
MADRTEHELDRILDSALANYSGREPWPGIEQRILCRLQERAPDRSWLRLAVLLSAAASVLMMVGDLNRAADGVAPQENLTQEARSTSPLQMQRTPAVSEKPVEMAKQVERHRRARPGAERRSVRQVPAPPPVTAEELAVMQLAVSNPRVLANALAARERLNEPVVVASLYIPPLAINDLMEDE